jgi:hypothetical protein
MSTKKIVAMGQVTKATGGAKVPTSAEKSSKVVHNAMKSVPAGVVKTNMNPDARR